MTKGAKAFQLPTGRGRVIGLGLATAAVGALVGADTGLFAAIVVGMTLAAAALSAHRERALTGADACNDPATRLGTRDGLIAQLTARAPQASSGQTAVILAEIDDFHQLEERHVRTVIEAFLRHCADCLLGPLAQGDLTAHLDGPRFAVAMTGADACSLETTLQRATRLQQALSTPFQSSCGAIQATASVGFALSDRIKSPDPEELMQAATCALVEAQRSAPAAIRSYSDGMRKRIASRSRLSRDVETGLATGQIRPYFQPQFDLGSGRLAGFEALSRWHHPKLGLVSPAEFLPILRDSGRMDHLGQLMVSNTLDALRHWDDRGHDVPQVGVNFSTEELQSPQLVDRLAMTLETRDIAPHRLVIEVLETVVARCADDQVARNLAGLSQLGCGIDLDDFGTGYASITNIRKLSINRIKIDRSFIARVDEDIEQQDMIAAILTMADRLHLQTLAEGVETPGEQAMLTRLGCGYAQGFLFARPMPLDEADSWLAELGTSRTPAVEMRRRSA
ncbi:putative bifunctional diguanylate cyclase/phosphodiesterase [Salibaculum sp.]|uniref:putative bifunctional diguanylate cyclase/phosphodiesterase n=1 Tax=Salibaculum sp. TaxID=2855480 RepID=UPI002B490D00|nr:EAL domain-containing protein [Salibaculum sp.]HKL69428.1 EAL domain-containing protein [Salibaculum sp.]